MKQTKRAKIVDLKSRTEKKLPVKWRLEHATDSYERIELGKFMKTF